MISTLSRPYPCCYGVPVITGVDHDVFVKTYFTHCLQCSFCHDSCCQYGVDIDVTKIESLYAHADLLQKYVTAPKEEWVDAERWVDAELPGGACGRTRVVDGACVFLDRKGRGCLIHKCCIENGIDYHDLKPMISCLFPLTFEHGILMPALEIEEKSLVCIGPGPSLYRGVRFDLEFYFGRAFVEEMDALEASVVQRSTDDKHLSASH